VLQTKHLVAHSQRWRPHATTSVHQPNTQHLNNKPQTAKQKVISIIRSRILTVTFFLAELRWHADTKQLCIQPIVMQPAGTQPHFLQYWFEADQTNLPLVQLETAHKLEGISSWFFFGLLAYLDGLQPGD
jgi:hypothetical protein